MPLLPGLWAIFFGMGILASRQLLPRPVIAVGIYYVLCGLICLALSDGNLAYSPWLMVLPFGIGQLSLAGILYWTLERNHAG
jgi:hypothetical protein